MSSPGPEWGRGSYFMYVVTSDLHGGVRAAVLERMTAGVRRAHSVVGLASGGVGTHATSEKIYDYHNYGQHKAQVEIRP